MKQDRYAIEKDRAQARLNAEADALEADEDVAGVMSTPEGRRFTWRLLCECGIFRTSFNTNALSMAFAEGQRNIGLMLQARLAKAAPKMYQTMLEENGGDRSKQPHE